MNKEEKKAAFERSVFRKFLDVRHRQYELSAIQSQRPPAPDILYGLIDSERIAFELAEFCSEDMAQAQARDLKNCGCTYVRTADPSVRILKDKLSKKYETNHPIELLCYTNGRIVSPDDFIMARMRCHLRTLAPDRGVFRRIWFWGRDVHVLYDRCEEGNNKTPSALRWI